MTYVLGGGKTWSPIDHCSERKAGHWTACVDCSLLMLARANLVNVASTLANAVVLRKPAGYPPEGPTGLSGFRAAFRVRYGFFYTIDQPADPLVRLQPGWAASITGSMSAFPASHTLRRWDRAFGGVHQWFAAHLPDGRVLVDDPLAPEGAGYAGQIVSKDQLRAFYAAAGSSRRIGYIESGKPAAAVIPVLASPPPAPVVTPSPPPVVVPSPIPSYTADQVNAAVAEAIAATKAGAHIVFEGDAP
jgi:hypothetical protein